MGIVPIQIVGAAERKSMPRKERFALLADDLIKASAQLGGARLLTIAAEEVVELGRTEQNG